MVTGFRSMIRWVYFIYIYIYIFVYLIFGDISIWWCNFFGSQAKKFDLSLSLNLILSMSLALLINQAKPGQTEFKLFGILTSSSSNIVFKLLSKLKSNDEPNSNTHYLVKLSSLTTLLLCYKLIKNLNE